MVKEIFNILLPYLRTLLPALLIILGGILVYRVGKKTISRVAKKRELATPVSGVLYILFKWFVVLTTIFLTLQHAGMIQNVWSTFITIVATIAIAFVAGWSLLSHILATLLILIYRPYNIGEKIEIAVDDVKGEVINLNLFYTTLKGENGLIIQVPNNSFFLKPVIRVPGVKKMPLYDQLQSDEHFEA